MYKTWKTNEINVDILNGYFLSSFSLMLQMTINSQYSVSAVLCAILTHSLYL